ncbi:MAG: hypothetical protein QM820_47080 [Minicystis sp.]
MAALTATRLTKDSYTNGEIAFPVKASTKIYAGAMVDITGAGSGYAAPMTKATALKCKGVAKKDVDNSSGANGAAFVIVQLSQTPNGTRPFKFDNDPGAGALAQADVGATVYALDDHTVSKTSTGATAVGEFVRLDADGGVWIEIK